MPTCFVIMGFGEKTDLATGRKLDLDKTYKNMIKPAITAAGYDCVRADELVHSGVIDVPMYDMLYTADLVVADLSTSNLNAAFELGVRHALKPRSTIVIAEKEFRNPFDINHLFIRSYTHLGSDIGFEETMRVRQELQSLAETLKVNAGIDSPVYTILPNLEQPKLRCAPVIETVTAQPRGNESETMAVLRDLAYTAKDACDFDLAKTIFRQLYDQQIEPGPDGTARLAWPCVTRELALATFKAGEKAAETAGPAVAASACGEAMSLLQPLRPETTTDPDTLRLWSIFHMQRAEMAYRTISEKQADVEIAIDASERAFAIKRDCHNGAILAYLLILRAAMSSGDDRTADRIRAGRIRLKVIDLAQERLNTLETEADSGARDVSSASSSSALVEERFWTAASLGVALIANSDPAGPEILQKAIGGAPAKWMGDVTLKQVDKLQKLLAVVRG
jgi:hypothetical protein